MELTFEFERETKNTLRYKENPEFGKPVIVGTIYVQKFAFQDSPGILKVTVEEVKGK